MVIVMKEAAQLALGKTLKAVNGLSISTPRGGFKRCQCVLSVIVYVVTTRLVGFLANYYMTAELSCETMLALPEDIRKLYKYTGRASLSHKQVIQQPSRHRMDRFSCCIDCETHLESER